MTLLYVRYSRALNRLPDLVLAVAKVCGVEVSLCLVDDLGDECCPGNCPCA